MIQLVVTAKNVTLGFPRIFHMPLKRQSALRSKVDYRCVRWGKS